MHVTRRQLVAAAVLLLASGCTYLVKGSTSTFNPLDALTSSGVPPAVFSALNDTGMWVQEAHQTFTTGDPRVVVAYIEGGINLHDAAFAQTIDASLWVNWKDLPVPCVGSTLSTATMTVGGTTMPCSTYYSGNFADYDIDRDGAVNALEWAQDPRVTDANGNGVIDPEDLLVAFQGNQHVDPDGFVNDVFGYDFYEHQPDPATQDAAYGHANAQMAVIHQMCPRCMIMPIRAGDEALDATTYLAEAWRYACLKGASVIVSVTADLGYSSAMDDAISYCNGKGVAMLESSNDFDTNDHQGGMEHPYVVPGNGFVSNVAGLTPQQAAQVPERHWTRSDLTSWGPHNELTAATQGGSTSESTPTLGGVVALLLSYGYRAADAGIIPRPLTGTEAVQLLKATAEPVQDPTLPWPGSPGYFNPQYGYGMPNVYAAMLAVAGGEVPPTVQIVSPRWYQVTDPTTQRSVDVRARVSLGTRSRVALVADWGLGANPASFERLGARVLSRGGEVDLGQVQLASVPTSYWSHAPYVDYGKDRSYSDQYDLTIRVRVLDGSGSFYEDRRTIEVFHDASALPGFPMAFPGSLESAPALVDLQGTGRLDIVFATTDGYVHAIDPQTGQDLPGWPQHTLPAVGDGPFSSLWLGYEPVLAPVAVGDLNHDGHQEVVVTSLLGHTYAFSSNGSLLLGWPKALDKGVQPPPIPRPANPYTREAVAGAIAPPVLAQLDQSGRLYVIQAGTDGYVHVWNSMGQDLPGWPVKVSLPSSYTPPAGYHLINDARLVSQPAVVYFDGRGSPPLIVVRSQYLAISGSGISPLAYNLVFAYDLSGSPAPGWPVSVLALAAFYGSAMDALTEGVVPPIPVDAFADGRQEVVVTPIFTPPYLLGKDGSVIGQYGSLARAALSALAIQQNPLLAMTPSALPPEEPLPFSSYPAVGTFGGSRVLSVSGEGSSTFVGAELVPSSGLGINTYTTAYLLDPRKFPGAEAQAFPHLHAGLDLLGSPLLVPVSPDGVAIVEGGDAGLIEAYLPDGSQAPGFPKYTGSWTVFSPAAGDLFGTGQVDVVAGTRDGYLFAWATTGSAAQNSQWWHSFGDDQNNSDPANDLRPPGIVRDATFSPLAGTLSFIAPGDVGYVGQVDHYEVLLVPQDKVVDVPASAAAGATQSIQLPPSAGVVIQAVSPSGVLGCPVAVDAAGEHTGMC